MHRSRPKFRWDQSGRPHQERCAQFCADVDGGQKCSLCTQVATLKNELSSMFSKGRKSRPYTSTLFRVVAFPTFPFSLYSGEGCLVLGDAHYNSVVFHDANRYAQKWWNHNQTENPPGCVLADIKRGSLSSLSDWILYKIERALLLVSERQSICVGVGY